MEELQDALRNVEDIWPETDLKFQEEVKKLAWVEEMLEEAISNWKSYNNRLRCQQDCGRTLEDNLSIFLCFCGKHREFCPPHRYVEIPPKRKIVKVSSEPPSAQTNNRDEGASPQKKLKQSSPQGHYENTSRKVTFKSPPAERFTEEIHQGKHRLITETRSKKPQSTAYIQFNFPGAKLKGLCFRCGKIGHITEKCQAKEGILIVKKIHWEYRGKLLLSNPSKSNDWFVLIKKVIDSEKPISKEHEVRIAGQYLRGYMRDWYDRFLEIRVKTPVRYQPEPVKKSFTNLEGLKEVLHQAFRVEHKEPPQGPKTR